MNGEAQPSLAIVDRREWRRRQRGLFLTAILSIVYFGFIFLVAFAPRVMAQPLFGVISLGLVMGIAEIVFAVFVTGLYVWQANADDRRPEPCTGDASKQPSGRLSP